MKSGYERRAIFKIREARRGDLAEIVKMSAGVKEIENYPGQRMRADDFIHFLGGKDAAMFVAVVPGKARARVEVVGYVTVYRSENYFYLPYAVTKKGWRRHGIGGALLSAVERLAKEEEVEYILMSVYAYNKTVGTFLKARGYVASRRLIQFSKIITAKGRK
jgi:ribosomal protein S18 acetylase RimI-like enzyme